MSTIDPEFLKALELVAEYDRNRPKVIKEFRLYYNEDGSIIGLWESNHPDGNYIVLDDPEVFHTTNTNAIKVVDGRLKVLDLSIPNQTKLIKSTSGQRVVAGNAAIALRDNENYKDIEYYARRNN